MNIICGTLTKMNVSLHITDTLERMGHSVRFFPTEPYREICSYSDKKLDKLGFHQGRERYLTHWRENFFNTIEEFQPDVILFLNSPNVVLHPENMKKIKHRFTPPFPKIMCWFVDSIITREGEESLFPYYDHVYVFEKRDISFLQEHCHITAEYCPVGYNAAYVRLERGQDKDVDISFMGAPFRNRLHILEEVAAHAARHNWRMAIYGPFYEDQYFWKKPLFQRKYPYIARYLTNGMVLPEDAAQLYARSKICLNIHLPAHKGVNPRTFEIMATGSFQLIDEREDYAGLVPERDMVIFRSTEELIEKISYYLAHEDERERIAAHGHAAVLGRYSMEASLNRILNCCSE